MLHPLNLMPTTPTTDTIPALSLKTILRHSLPPQALLLLTPLNPRLETCQNHQLHPNLEGTAQPKAVEATVMHRFRTRTNVLKLSLFRPLSLPNRTRTIPTRQKHPVLDQIINNKLCPAMNRLRNTRTERLPFLNMNLIQHLLKKAQLLLLRRLQGHTALLTPRHPLLLDTMHLLLVIHRPPTPLLKVEAPKHQRFKSAEIDSATYLTTRKK